VAFSANAADVDGAAAIVDSAATVEDNHAFWSKAAVAPSCPALLGVEAAELLRAKCAGLLGGGGGRENPLPLPPSVLALRQAAPLPEWLPAIIPISARPRLPVEEAIPLPPPLPFRPFPLPLPEVKLPLPEETTTLP
jgi:hypothetical protein